MQETTYGDVNRLNFLRRVIAEIQPDSILDIGCGTGARVTRPLAEEFPRIQVRGVDTDANSVAWAAQDARDLPNLTFATPDCIKPEECFGLIIASEVIEHVDDPVGFLSFLQDHAAPGSRIVLTLPNGFGPSEAMSLIEVGLNLSGAQKLLRRLKYLLLGRSVPPLPSQSDTLAVSPHINFFSYREITSLFAAVGMPMHYVVNRTFLCGYILDSLIRRPALVDANVAVAARLPRCMVSDWMFELSPAAVPHQASWRRGAYARFRKWLNEKRWGLT